MARDGRVAEEGSAGATDTLRRGGPTGADPGGDREDLLAAPPPERAALVMAYLRRQATRALGLERAGLRADRSLIGQGLDSLAAAELAGAIESGLGVEVPLASLFQGVSLAQLGEQVLELLSASAAAPGAVARRQPAMVPAGRPGTAAARSPLRFPLSWGQRALWLLDSMAPGNPAYVLAGAARLRGDLAGPWLRHALQILVERHPALRTTFELDGEQAVQVVREQAAFGFSEKEAAAWSAEQVAAWLSEEAERPFDLARGPLLRVALLDRGERGQGAGGERLVVLAVHHLVADFRSLGILLGELGALLRGEVLPPLAGSYGEFVHWQAERLAGAAGERLGAYWSAALPAGAPPLELATDRPRPPVQTFRGGSCSLWLDREPSARFLALGHGAGATDFMTLLAAFLVLLHRTSGQAELRVGTPAAGRLRPEWNGLVGYFVNPVVVRGDLAGDPDFGELLGRVRETAIAAFAHQEFPFPLLVERLGGARDPSRSPIFQAMFVLYRERRPSERGLGGLALGEAGVSLDLGGGLVLESVPVRRRSAPFELTLRMAEIDGALACSLQFDSDLFDATTAGRMLGQLAVLISALAGGGVARAAGAGAAPSGLAGLARLGRVSALPLLSGAEAHQLLVEWNDTGEAPAGDACLHQLFERQAARTPAAAALDCDGRVLSYGELDRWAGRLARRLRCRGVGPEVLVGICLERRPEMLAAILAVLKAGGAYVPLDPAYPPARLRSILEHTGMPVLITTGRLAPLPRGQGPEGLGAEWIDMAAFPADLPQAEARLEAPEGPPAVAGPPPLASNLAYVIHTSGSTGLPKGVAITHASAVTLVRWAAEAFTPAELAGVLAATSICFDLSVFELFVPLACGGTVVLAETALDLPACAGAERVTLVNTVPSALAELIGSAGLPPGVRTVNLAGEPLPRSLVERLRELPRRPTVPRVVNLYGPTEDTTYSTWAVIAPGEAGPPAIGRPIRATRAYVVDRHLVPVPPGVPGELLLGGAGLARGYLGRPDLTAERFVPDPFAAAPVGDRRGGGEGGGREGGGGGRLYRTGDLARWRAGGSLEFLGRIDRQVKIRGFRIEPGEIEAALARQRGVREAVVLALAGADGGKRLAAYVVPEGSPAPPAPGAEELRAGLAGELPGYMVPEAFVVLAALPLLPNGKLDRQALPAPRWGAAGPAAGYVAPRSAEEERLTRLWSELLDLAPTEASGRAFGAVGVHDSFFALGGHSLTGARLLARVREELGVELPLRSLFETPTLAGLAGQIARARASRPDRPATAPPVPAGPGAEPSGPVRRSRAAGHLPLSFAQRRLWLLAQVAPDSAAYNVAGALRIGGALDVSALSRGLDEVVRRHEALRTTFALPGQAGGGGGGAEPRQLIGAPCHLPLPVVNLAELPRRAGRRAAAALAAAEARRPFDLSAGPLLRARLLRLGGGRHLLLLTLHHIVCDGRSLDVLLRDLTALYAAARTAPGVARAVLPELPYQYADWAVWERERLQGQRLAELLGYWRLRLAGSAPALELPADRPRPRRESARGGRVPIALPAADVARLAALGRRRRATLFMTLLAALDTLLYRYTGQPDLLVGTPVANRPPGAGEDLVGFFVNTLALRAGLSGEPSFGELLERVRGDTLEDLAHQELPFDALVEELAPQRERGPRALVQVMLALRVDPRPPLTAAGLTLEADAVETGTAKFDLTFDLATGRGSALEGGLEYRSDLFDAATAMRLGGHWQALLAGIAAGPERRLHELPWLGAGERHQLLVEWPDTATAYPRQSCVHELFALAARDRPAAVAVTCNGRQLTYGELDNRSNQLARRLRRLGVGPEVPVALWLERSLEMIVAVVGVLKSGGAYVPLDPSFPSRRVELILRETAAPVLLTQRHRLGSLPAGFAERRGRRRREVLCLDGEGQAVAGESAAAIEPATVGAGNLAYVMYTSGSTGAPKGVAVVHRSLVRLVRETGYHRFAPGQVFLQLAPLAFDASTFEIWGALANGGTLALFPPPLPDLEELSAVVERAGVTTLFLTTSLFQQMIEDDPAGLRPLRHLLTGGETMSVPHMRRALRELPDTLVVHAYGPTENTTFTTCHRMTAAPRQEATAGSPIPIGRPIANTIVHLWDRHGRPVPIGVPGELVIGGDGLARGYFGRPDLTAERFVPDPFGGERGEPGARVYRTGDLARYLPDGNVDFLGRLDEQVKIRGFRIEPGEIEASLARHPGVEQAVVVARQAAPGDRRLVAYVVARPGSAASAGELRAALERELPAYMVPAAFVFLPALPLTANGKVDRRALPEPGWKPGEPATAPWRPLDAEEELLAALWAELLGGNETAGRIGPHDNFFALGGHSLLATRLVSRLRATFRIDLPLAAVFEAPTLAELAGRIRVARASEAPPLLPRAPGEAAGAVAGELSYAQERIWFLDRLAPGSAAYNVAGALRLRGRLDPAALRRSLDEIVRRHEVLRSAYPVVAGRPSQVPLPRLALDLPVVDLSALERSAKGPLATGLGLGSGLGRQPFDLATGPLLRATLLRLAAEEHLLVLALHHIVADGWSVAVFRRELAALYAAFAAGRPSPLAALPIQYADFAHWQRGWLAGEALATLLAHWRRALAGAPAELELPVDRPRPPVQSFRGARLGILVPPGLVAELRRGARRSGATLFMALLAAFEVLLWRTTGQEDLVVGSPIANRGRLEIEGLIGCFVNTLALRADLSGPPGCRELLARVRQVCLAAYAHQDLPFERLVEMLAPQRNLATTPLFQVMLTLQNAGTGGRTRETGPLAAPRQRPGPLAALEIELCGLEITTAKFDLTVDALETPQGLAIAFEYCRDLFDATTVRRLADHYLTLLAAFCATLPAAAAPATAEAPETPEDDVHGPRPPGIAELPWLSAAEIHQLMVEWNDTAAAPAALAAERLSASAARVHELFEWQAARRPQGLAVAGQGVTLTYGELERRANRLAHYLRRLGVGPEVRVGLCLERSPEMVVALLGILKAGGAYLPLDPAHPAARLALLLGDGAVAVVVTELRFLERLGLSSDGAGPYLVCLDREGEWIAAEQETPVGEPALAGDGQSLAYLLYTSGSTGRPKGVGLAHAAVVSFLRAMALRPGLGSGDVVPALTTLAFDIAGLEIYLPLAVGGRVEVVGREESADGRQLAARLAASAVTAMQATPASWRLLLDAGWAGRRGFKALCGGEALSRELALELLGRGVELWNLYGPTETAVWSAAGPVAAAGLAEGAAVALGRPIANTRCYVVDRRCEPVAMGVAGELLIGGEGVARGYWGRPELTAASFVPDPWRTPGGARLYRTGDLVRWRAGGELEFLGRIDTQVKIRGFRIELGEVESTLVRHAEVGQAVVVARGEGTARRLVAYLVARHGRSASPRAAAGRESAALREHLRRTLPEFMVPAELMWIERLPLTSSGKIDRRALSLLEPPGDAAEEAGPEPLLTPLEELVAGIWQEILGGGRPRRSDSFFDVGGHSLFATVLASRLGETLRVELPLAAIFASPTVAGLAAAVEAARSAGGMGGMGSLQRPAICPLPRDRPLPLSHAQERLWFLDRLAPGRAVYNVPLALAARGGLAPARVDAVLSEVVRRHEVLRTRVVEAGGQAAQLVDPPRRVRLPLVELAALPAERRQEEALQLAREEARRPFDLARGPLLRGAILSGTGPRAEDQVLLLDMHHIVSDGWSLGLLVEEFGALYRAALAGSPSPLAELPIQYADYAAWQRRWLSEEEIARQLAYWRERLAGAPAALDLPADRPHPAAQSFRGGLAGFTLDGEEAGRLGAAGRRHGATLFMTLLAGFAALLTRSSGQEDLVVGSPIANRHQRATERLIGFFVNSLALRLDLTGDPSGKALLERVRETALAAYAHQDLPFERLVEEIRPERQLSQNPLFQVMLALQNAPFGTIELPGLTLTRLQPEGLDAKFDLALFWSEAGATAGQGLAAELSYAADLFDPPTAARLLAHLRELLAGLVADPGRPLSALPLLAAAERHQLAVEWNAAPAAAGDDVVVRFGRRAAAAPLAPALTVPGERREERLSYADLDAWANRVARRLCALGVEPGAPVALAGSRGPALVAGLLGILKAGGAFVPLDPELPAARLAFLLEDSEVAIVVGEERALSALPPHRAAVVDLGGEEVLAQRAEPPLAAGSAGRGDLAYLIYTSGTTGRPKAVAIERGTLADVLGAVQELLRFGPSDRVLCTSPFSFDFFIFELLTTLTTGGEAVLFPLRPVLDFERLAAALPEATVLQAVPAVARQLLAAHRRRGGRPLAALRTVMLGGDRVPVELLADLQPVCPRAQAWVIYGPSETTILCTAYRVPRDRGPLRSLLGRPLPGCRLELRDRRGRLVPAGVAGEIWIGGAGVTRGYFRRPELTAEKYAPGPAGARLFRSGDLARQLPDGNYEFLGRIDGQVKVRGFRVETGEVESVLARHPAVREAVVVARPSAGGGAEPVQQLVAYVVAHQEALAPVPEAASAAAHIATWKALYDETYDSGELADPTLNLAGWNSSYTGLPIPPEEMREWVETTVERVLALGPRRVLEVGCGTGLLLFRVAPHCARYLGTDFSRAALDFVARELARPERALPQVSLAQALADDWRGVARGDVDLVILNSVVQYFPGADYLLRVLEQAVATVAPGGKIFLGDLRSLPLAEAFCTSIELAAAPAALPVAELRRRVRRRMVDEEELLVAPELFAALARRLPAISRVDVWKKRGHAVNELTRFRYDVVLTVGGGDGAAAAAAAAAPAPDASPGRSSVRRLDWRVDGLDLPALAERLAVGPEGVVITGIPDRRLLGEAAAVALLAEPGPETETVGQLRQAVAERVAAEDGVDPEELWELATGLGYTVELVASGPTTEGGLRFVAVLEPAGAGPALPVAALPLTALPVAALPVTALDMAAPAAALPRGSAPAAASVEPAAATFSLRGYANDPLRSQLVRDLVPALRRQVKAELPDYMVPAAFVVLDSLPLTAHGKLDRAALPAPDAVRPALAEAYAAPRTPLEESLAQLWADLLGLDRVGVDDDFFELGGHSLLATQVVSRLRERFAVELPVRVLFEEPTVAGLAGRLLAARLAADAGVPTPPLVPLPRAGGSPLALSFAQHRLWFLDRLRPGLPTYNIPLTVRVTGELAVPAMAASVAAIVRRHETLRTTFHEVEGEPRQVVAAPPGVGHALPLVDLAALGLGASAAALGLAAAEARRPFDLARGPLFRPLLLRLAEREHLFLGTLHHIVSDGWSVAILVRELSTLYGALASGRAPRLPALPVQYADYAAWQRQWLSGDVLAAKIGYWRERLAGLPARLELPTDRPRPPAETTAGDKRPFRLPAGPAGRLRELAAAAGATPFMLLLAAFHALLGRYTGQQDLAVGTPIAGRNRVEIEGLIGFFVNSLVLRAELTGDPAFGELLERTRQAALAAYAHQELPFERLVEELAPERSFAYQPLFQVMFALQNMPVEVVDLPGLALASLPVASRTAKFELSLALSDVSGGFAGSLEYKTDLFDAATADRLLGHYAVLLEAVAAEPARRLSELPLLTAAERHQVRVEWNATAWEAGREELIQAPFERQAARDPEAVALVGWQQGAPMLSYGELEAWANRLAGELRGLGVGPEAVVGVCAAPCFALVAGLLAILKAGGAYLALDPGHPPERLAQLLADSGARLVLAEPALAERLPAAVRLLPLSDPPVGARSPADALSPPACAPQAPAGGPQSPAGAPRSPRGAPRSPAGAPPPAPACPAQPDNAAYVLYTSGSTGRPKGVVVSHRAVVNRLRFQVAADLAPGARVLQRTSLTFDVSVVEIFAPLWTGAAVVLSDAARRQEAAYLARLVAERQVTNLTAPPALLPALLGEEAFRRLGSLCRVVTGGERVPGELPRRFAAAMAGRAEPAPALLARYGPTEATVSVTEWRCGGEPAGPSVPLGRPIAGARLHLLDGGGREVPLGVPGELCIAGVCLARGYLGRPELTADAFVPDPFAAGAAAAGGRLYRSGDLARFRPGGVLEFLGRIDRQVKVRGFRLELEEVEAALARHPAVGEAAVVDRDEPATGGKRLVAYVAARDGADPGGLEPRQLRAFLESQLPAYMLPAAFVVLPRLPLTPSGKVDRQGLPAPPRSPLGGQGTGGHVAPRTQVEELLAGLWAEVLGIEQIGVRDDFFALGGHSLLAVRLMARIRERFGRELPLATLFRAGSIERLAVLLEAGSVPAARSALVDLTPEPPAAAAAARTRPFFCVHPAGGNVLCYAELARALGPGQPFYGLQLPEPETLGPAPTIETIAALYVAALAAVAPAGPYALGGWSLGAAIAFEMGRQLRAAGREVDLVALIDPSPLPRRCGPAETGEALLEAEFGRDLLALSGRDGEAALADLRRLDPALRLAERAVAAQAAGLLPPELGPDEVVRLFAFYRTTRRALDRYRPATYPGRLTLFVAQRPPGLRGAADGESPALAWAPLAGAGAELEPLPGDHYSILRAPAVAALARRLRRRLTPPAAAAWVAAPAALQPPAG